MERGAHADEVRPAYHATSKAVHPDKNPDRVEEATEAMQMAVDANDVLSDARRRRAYMLAGSWWRYVAELERAEEATRQRRGGEARERDARRDEKRQREEWHEARRAERPERSTDGKEQRSHRSHTHRRASGQRRARTDGRSGGL